MYFKHKLALKHGKFGVCEIPAIKQNSLDLFGGHSHHMNFDERPQKAVAHRDIEAFVVHTGKVWASLDDVTTVAVQMAVENRFKHQVGSHTLYQVQPGSFPVMNMFPEVEFTSLNKRSSENSLKLGRVRSAYWGQYSADFFKNFLYTCDRAEDQCRDYNINTCIFNFLHVFSHGLNEPVHFYIWVFLLVFIKYSLEKSVRLNHTQFALGWIEFKVGPC